MLSQLFVKGLILPAQVRYFVTNAISMGNHLTIPVLRFRTANEATQPLKLSHYSGPILPDFTTPFSPQIKPLNSKKKKKKPPPTLMVFAHLRRVNLGKKVPPQFLRTRRRRRTHL